MDGNQYILKSLRNDITQHHLQLQAIIQDTNSCVGSLAELQSLNTAGRAKIAILRKLIDKFSTLAKEVKDEQLLKDLLSYKEQMSISMDAFKTANIRSMLAIETHSKNELFSKPTQQNENERNYVGNDGNLHYRGVKSDEKKDQDQHDKAHLAKISSSVTDQLLSISRQLADTTTRSADTLDTLLMSSDAVHSTQEELHLTAGTIGQSGKLLAKYERREFTDKILMFFAFSFFLACVLYIVQKRLF